MKATVAGSIVMDITIYSTKHFKIIKDYFAFPFDHKIQVDKIFVEAGGSGYNVSSAITNFGNKVHLFGAIGKDTYGQIILKSMKKNKIKTDCIKIINNELTGFSLIFLYGSEKTIVTYRGANNYLSEEDLIESKIKNSDIFLFTSMTSNQNIKFIRKAISIGKKYGVKIFCNPSIAMVEHQKDNLREFIRESDFVIMNKKEALSLTNAKDLKVAIYKLKKISGGIPIVTAGKLGCFVYDEKIKNFKAYDVDVIDTTGAGDAFTGAFVHALYLTEDLEYSLRFANAAAAIKISSHNRKIPSEKEVVKFMEEKS
ncbi:MAG: carbohydrate kinase family protein [Candidatus Aenigmatarchaeota archaeon]